MKTKFPSEEPNFNVVRALSMVLKDQFGWQDSLQNIIRRATVLTWRAHSELARVYLKACIADWSVEPLRLLEADMLVSLDVADLLSTACMQDPGCSETDNLDQSRAAAASALVFLFLVKTGRADLGVCASQVRELVRCAVSHFRVLPPQERRLAEAIIWELGAGPRRAQRTPWCIVARTVIECCRGARGVPKASWRLW
jgi:hypothetical protein